MRWLKYSIVTDLLQEASTGLEAISRCTEKEGRPNDSRERSSEVRIMYMHFKDHLICMCYYNTRQSMDLDNKRLKNKLAEVKSIKACHAVLYIIL